MTITRKDVLAAQALADAATPGPWTASTPDKDADGWAQGVIVAAVALGQCVYSHTLGGSFPVNDQSLIAACRTSVPALADALLEAVALIHTLRREVENVADQQAMPDESWIGRVAVANAFLAAFDKEAT